VAAVAGAAVAGAVVAGAVVAGVVVMDGKLMQIFVYIKLKMIVFFLGVDTMVCFLNKKSFSKFHLICLRRL